MVQLPPDSFLCVNVVKQRVIYCSINETRILRAFGAHHRDSRHILPFKATRHALFAPLALIVVTVVT